MAKRQKRTVWQSIKWWWITRVIGFWRVRLGGFIKQQINPIPEHVRFNKNAGDFPAPDTSGITAILTAYRRTEYLADQVRALRTQTVPPEEIWVWTNQSSEKLVDMSSQVDRVIVSNANWSFWGRFALANLVRTGYVAFFDDDILPQPKWLENCLQTIEKGYDGILGGSGVILPTEGGYSSKNKVGWNGAHLPNAEEVDLVGHAWFFQKKYMNYMWREEPRFWENGEDIHLSYMALKHGGIKTWVPPHPENDKSMWSCRPDFGKTVGRQKTATFKTSGHKQVRTDIVNQFTDEGWETVLKRNIGVANDIKEFSTDLRRFNKKLLSKECFSLVRFGDGEMMVINGEKIDLSQKCNGEHKYTPENKIDERFREILRESLVYQDKQYFVGLPCRCCVGDNNCDRLRNQSGQNEKQLTWANIFVNSNYPIFLAETVDGIKSNTVSIICHLNADISALPFNVCNDFRIGSNAWVNDYDSLLEQIQSYIKAGEIRGQVFVFCAGVLSNMVILQLTKIYPENTYIDVGSVFDDVLGLGKTRKYLKGSRKRLKKVCVW